MIVIVMGVSGSGKTTIGRALSEALGWPFYEGDDFHPPDNVARMASGIPLTDADRQPWLERLRDLIAGLLARGQDAVLASSALRRRYRDLLRVDPDQVRFVYLKGSHDLFARRLHDRRDHYMKADMLRSQLDALEEPRRAITVDAAQPPQAIVDAILQHLEQAP